MKVSDLKSWSAQQAISILAVDNIKIDEFGLKLLKDVEDGILTYDEALKKVRDEAIRYSK